MINEVSVLQTNLQTKTEEHDHNNLLNASEVTSIKQHHASELTSLRATYDQHISSLQSQLDKANARIATSETALRSTVEHSREHQKKISPPRSRPRPLSPTNPNNLPTSPSQHTLSRARKLFKVSSGELPMNSLPSQENSRREFARTVLNHVEPELVSLISHLSLSLSLYVFIHTYIYTLN